MRFQQATLSQHTVNSRFNQLATPTNTPYVPIIYSYAGADQQLLEALLAHTQLDGLVIAGTGAGRCSPLEEQAVRQARAQGIPVVMSSRVGAGSVLPIACYEELGLITLDNLSPQQARIWLLLDILSQRG